MAFFSFFLLPKSTGGFRTIGVLPTLYRVWAKLKMPLDRAWSAGVPRSYFAAGVGKATEDAVGRLLLTAEAKQEGEEVACMIVDIDKCYEHVDHHKLLEAACRYGFPLAILRLCLAMYRAARALAWNGVYSKFVHSGRTVVPGCSIALWLVQLIMMSPLVLFDDQGSSHLPGRRHRGQWRQRRSLTRAEGRTSHQVRHLHGRRQTPPWPTHFDGFGSNFFHRPG